LQSHQWGSNEEGGCPFKHASLSYLKNLLPCCQESDWKQVEAFVSSQQYTAACRTYLSSSMNAHDVSNRASVSKTAGSSVDDITDSGYESLQSNLSPVSGNSDVHCTVNSNIADVERISVDRKSFVGLDSIAPGFDQINEQDKCDLTALSDKMKVSVINELGCHINPVDFYRTYRRLLDGLQSVRSATVGMRS
jgi:hypothetical protein